MSKMRDRDIERHNAEVELDNLIEYLERFIPDESCYWNDGFKQIALKISRQIAYNLNKQEVNNGR